MKQREKEIEEEIEGLFKLYEQARRSILQKYHQSRWYKYVVFDIVGLFFLFFLSLYLLTNWLDPFFKYYPKTLGVFENLSTEIVGAWFIFRLVDYYFKRRERFSQFCKKAYLFFDCFVFFPWIEKILYNLKNNKNIYTREDYSVDVISTSLKEGAIRLKDIENLLSVTEKEAITEFFSYFSKFLTVLSNNNFVIKSDSHQKFISILSELKELNIKALSLILENMLKDEKHTSYWFGKGRAFRDLKNMNEDFKKYKKEF